MMKTRPRQRSIALQVLYEVDIAALAGVALNNDWRKRNRRKEISRFHHKNCHVGLPIHPSDDEIHSPART